MWKTNHSKKGCYEVIGYPDWWTHPRNCRLSQQKQSDEKKASGQLVMTVSEADATDWSWQ